MESKIISETNIKPSVRTPHHLRIHKLSLLDQIVPPNYARLVLYFPAAENQSLKHMSTDHDEFVSKTTQTLKQSLSETLTRFYPLAGRTRDDLSIDCNDEGVRLIVKKFKGSMSDVLKKPELISTQAHLPSGIEWFGEPGPGSYVAIIQVSYFDCGGIALGSLFFHKVVDGATISTFLKAWATRARGLSTEIIDDHHDDQDQNPDYYTAQSFFPQNEKMQEEPHLLSAMHPYIKFGKTVERRYVFDSMAISKLREQVLKSSPGGGGVLRPSRVEIVSALIWKCFMNASEKYRSNDKKETVSVGTHSVNMRRKAETPFPEQSFGNFLWLVPASTTNKIDTDTKQLVCKLRDAIRKVDCDFVKKMQGIEDGFSGCRKNLEETWAEIPENTTEILCFASWCNFGIYDVDFGWGNPVWMTNGNAGGGDAKGPFLDFCWLTDTRQGGGVEAWVTLDERYAAAFDAVQELQALASIDPSPLDYAMPSIISDGVS